MIHIGAKDRGRNIAASHVTTAAKSRVMHMLAIHRSLLYSTHTTSGIISIQTGPDAVDDLLVDSRP